MGETQKNPSNYFRMRKKLKSCQRTIKTPRIAKTRGLNSNLKRRALLLMYSIDSINSLFIN